jgi:hypothetical protein
MTLTKLPQLAFSLLFVISSSGCGLLGGGGGLLPSVGGGIGGPKVYGQYDNSSGISIGRGERELKIQTAIEVTPDRGTTPVSINAHGGTFDSAAAQMQTAFADLKKIGGTPGCGFKVVNYAVPNSKDNLKWKTGGNAEIFVDTAGKDPDARFAAANTCFKALREYILALPKYDSNTESGFEMSAGQSVGPDIIWSVEPMEKHRDALVTQANERLKAVQKADAKMWDHVDVQCTSAGVVQVASANSHFVTLQLEMVCPVSAAEALSRVKTGQ